MIVTSYNFKGKKSLIDEAAHAVEDIKARHPGFEHLNVSKFVEYAIHRAACEDYRLRETDFVKRMRDYFSVRNGG